MNRETPAILRPPKADRLVNRDPNDFRETMAIAGVTLRPLRAEDAVEHDKFIARLDPGDARLRFGRDIAEVPRSELDRLTRIDGEREKAFVATLPRADGRWEIVGEVRAREDSYGARSEFAIVVRSDLQGLGLGRALLEMVIAFCRARGGRLLYGLVAASNTPMLGLARRLGFEVDHVPGGRTVVVSLDLQRAPRPSREDARGARSDSIPPVYAGA